ncbi:MAG: 3-isopropylmalate dehydratase [Firmicutes bacterium]|nr:3-isopropylmalate dehydratase [Bacillota bacterium]
MSFEGRAHKFGDDINTDYIISSRRKRDTLDLNILKQYIMEDIEPGFARKVKENDIIVAGENFGCGSAMEVASLVIKAAGINAVIAKSFARTFYRNGINGGIMLIECNTDRIDDGDILKIQMNKDKIIISNQTKGFTEEAKTLGGILFDLIKAGGLMEYIRKKGNFEGYGKFN